VELAYEADEAFGTVGPCWRRAVEGGRIEWEDYSNFTMVLRFAAGAMGIPFMPTRSLLGSDLLEQRALTDEQRRADPRTSPLKFHVMDSPFAEADRVVLVPAVHTEFAVLHVEAPEGHHRGQTFADVVQAFARKRRCDGRGDRGRRTSPERTAIRCVFVVSVATCLIHAVFNYRLRSAAEELSQCAGRASSGYLDRFVTGVRATPNMTIGGEADV
jgi:glutaconate CoA-transferase subunit A